MLAYPKPPLTPFQVTLLPEQQQQQMSSSSSPASATNAAAAPSSSAHRTLESARTESWSAATSMLHGILELAADHRRPQVKFASYSPETVMRSVRAIVDDERCNELLTRMQAAVRQYAEECVAKIAELRRQQQQHAATAHSSNAAPPKALDVDEEGNDDEREEEEGPRDRASVLDAVRTLAIFVTYYERLQHGVAELASVWVYANQWCSLHASRAIPRSLIAAATQEASDVFRGAPELITTALHGYCAVLGAELAADTVMLDQLTPTALAGTAAGGVAQLKSPATAADAQMDTAALDLLACPAALEQLTTPLRRRLLFLFTQLTRDSQQYNALVEPVVVRIMRRHFARVAQRWWAEEVSACKFFELSEKALKHADTVHQQYLHSGTIPLVEDAIQATLIGSVGAEVLKRDFTVLMEEEHFHALRLAWRLLSSSAHVRSAPAVVVLFREYLLECGQGIMEELVVGSTKTTPAATRVAMRERPFLAVRHLMGLLEQGSRTVERCFHECEKEFKVALHEALQTILEAYPSAFSEQLAAYQDAMMKEVEVGHVPVSLAAQRKIQEVPSGGSAGPHVAPPPPPLQHQQQQRSSGGACGGEEDEEEQEDGDSAPLRRQRAENASSHPTAGSAERNAAPAPPAPAAATSGEMDSALGSAALRHAAPLPAEATEATPVLRRIAYLYSYHSKKELFEAAYWRDFARRCLHPHRSVDVAAENAFICYLRDICGLSFTSKFEGMLTDLESSSQLTAQYTTWREDQTAASVSLAEEDALVGGAMGERTRLPSARSAVEAHLLILAQSFWPKYSPQPSQLYVPPSLQAITQSVSRFYTGLFPNRHLTWQHPLSTATLRAQLTPQSQMLSLTGTYVQCLALLRLDALLDRGVSSITVRELCESVGVDCANVEVLWSLQGLCHPRLRLVLSCANTAAATAGAKTTELANEEGETSSRGDVVQSAAASPPPPPPPGVLSPTDVLRLNLDFTSPTVKVRIPLQTRSRTTATAGFDGSGRGARTADNGGHLVEVAVISCLKARRTVSQAELAADVATRLPFPVSVPLLKKTVEKMIERGFMVRGKDNVYQFSA